MTRVFGRNVSCATNVAFTTNIQFAL